MPKCKAIYSPWTENSELFVWSYNGALTPVFSFQDPWKSYVMRFNSVSFDLTRDEERREVNTICKANNMLNRSSHSGGFLDSPGVQRVQYLGYRWWMGRRVRRLWGHRTFQSLLRAHQVQHEHHSEADWSWQYHLQFRYEARNQGTPNLRRKNIRKTMVGKIDIISSFFLNKRQSINAPRSIPSKL